MALGRKRMQILGFAALSPQPSFAWRLPHGWGALRYLIPPFRGIGSRAS
jgi:hypothetical protein